MPENYDPVGPLPPFARIAFLKDGWTMQADLISVIIPHYQDLENLAICLDRLDRQTLPRERFEIVISDNMSPVGLDAVARVVAGRAKIVSSTVKGAGHTRNVGVAAAAGSLFAFMDSDCRPDPDYLEKGIAALDRYDMVGGKIRVDIQKPGHPTAAEAVELVFAFRNKSYILKKHFTVTATLFVSRAIFEKVGPFRNDVSEDMEWCQRAHGLGYRLGYAEEAVIGHPARADWAELKKKWLRLTRESFLLYKTKRYGLAKWIVYSWVVLAATVPQSLDVLRSPNLPSLRDKIMGLGMLVRLRIMRFLWSHEVIYSSAGKHK